jgi:calcium/proton exchanger cax
MLVHVFFVNGLHIQARTALQIACFVLPVIVLVSWAIGPVPGHKAFTLDFDAFITLILTLSVIHAYFNSADGNSNWLAGVQLCTTYLLIALLYLFIKDTEEPPKQ